MKPGVKTSEFMTVIIGGIAVAALLVAELGFGLTLDENTKMTLLSALGLQSVYVGARAWLKTQVDVIPLPSGFKSSEFILTTLIVVGIVGVTAADVIYNVTLPSNIRDLLMSMAGMASVYIIGRKITKAKELSQSSSAVHPNPKADSDK